MQVAGVDTNAGDVGLLGLAVSPRGARGLRTGARLWRVPLDGAKAGAPQAPLDGRFGRLRTVVRAPDGALWVTTSNRDGRGSPGADDDRTIRVDQAA